MNRRSALAAVSWIQLGGGVLGLLVAIRRRHPYDLPVMHGRPEAVGRDSVLMGTALSAPVVMLAIQGAATVALARGRNDRWADQVLATIGAFMVAGYGGERLVRRRLQPAGWDPIETPLAATGISLSAAMAVLGFRHPALRT
jgi:hypothetical protein